jgi:hypothetical protein
VQKIATTAIIFPTDPIEYPNYNTHESTSNENEENTDMVII